MTWKDIEAFFCRGAYNTYASGAEPQTSPVFPGAKIYVYTEDDLQYVDMYYARKTGLNDDISLSGGITAITLANQPIWTMSYDGWHFRQDGIGEFLGKALCANYGNGVFIGGRGPVHYKPNGSRYSYFNYTHSLPGLPTALSHRIISPSSRAFTGKDYMIDREQRDTKVYCHYFRGKALIEKLP